MQLLIYIFARKQNALIRYLICFVWQHEMLLKTAQVIMILIKKCNEIKFHIVYKLNGKYYMSFAKQKFMNEILFMWKKKSLSSIAGSTGVFWK